MPTAYSYIRFSTPAQREGDSLRRQIARAEAFVREYPEHGLVLDTTYRDLGVSGFKGLNRIKGALGSFIGRIESGEIASDSWLVLENLDRLTREDVMEATHLFTGLILRGVTIAVLTMDDDEKPTIIDTARGNKDPNLLQTCISELARGNKESKRKSTKLTPAWEEKRQPTNLRRRKLTSVVPFWLKLKGRDRFERLDADWTLLNEAKVVRRIYQMCINGCGKEAIARILNEEGVPSPKRRDGWRASTVQFLLQDRRVLGEFQPMTKAGGQAKRPTGNPIPDYFPQIVTPTIFYAAQRAKQSRKRGGGAKKLVLNNLFGGGHARCDCGRSMEYRNKGYRNGIYLQCSGFHRKVGCQNSFKFLYPELEAAILDFVTDVQVPDADVTKAAMAGFRLNAKQAESEEYQGRLERIRRDLETEDDPEEVADLKRRRDDYKARIKLLRAEIDALDIVANQARRSPLDDRRAALRQLRADMADMTGTSLYEARAKVAAALRGVVNEVVCKPDGFYFAMLAGGAKGYKFEGGRLLGQYDFSQRKPTKEYHLEFCP